MALLLLGSGASALAYQVVWNREFRLIFGGSTSATSAVLAIITLGLGIGASVLGRRSDPSRNPLRLYGVLEALVAAGAALTPAALGVARSAYLGLGGEATLGGPAATAVRLALASVVLLIPTIAMGGTLPAAVAAIKTPEDERRKGVAALYGINTLGAVMGALVATFVALEAFGNRGTLMAAVGLNVVVAACALVRSRGVDRSQDSPEAEATTSVSAGEAVSTLRTDERPQRSLILFAAFLTGLVFFLLELVWYRMLGPILGGTVFTFGLILALALLGIGLGGAAYAFLPARLTEGTVRAFAWTCAVEGLLILLPFAAGDRVAIEAAILRGAFGSSFPSAVAGWSIIAGVVVLPPAIVAGFQFPLLISLLGRSSSNVGRDTASAYTWNMAGGIAGSLIGGFGAMPLLTAPGVWRACGFTMLALSLLIQLRSRSARHPLGVLLSVLALAPWFAEGPTAAWRHSQIGAGRSGVTSNTTQPAIDNWRATLRRSVLYEADGVESSVALRVIRGVAFLVNGKVDGHATLDAPTQITCGVLAAALHPNPKSAAVIGLGTGGTAGWLAAIPSIERVDVSELEPRIADIARILGSVNERVVESRKARLHFGDAREFLQTTRATYDIIVSEPSNPYRAGIASLFAREYYGEIRRRLNPGGIFVQWLQAYEIDLPAVRSVFATLRSEFPHVQVYRTSRDLLLLATAEPLVVSGAQLRDRLSIPPIARALAHGWWVKDLPGFLAYYVGGDGLAAAVAGEAEEAVTDDRNALEFGFARTLDKHGLFSVTELRERALALGEVFPPGIDEREVDAAAFAESVAEVYEGPLPRFPLDPAATARFETTTLAASDQLRAAAERWRSQTSAPSTLRQQLFAAEALAEMADPVALSFAASLGEDRASEAAAIATRFYLRTSHDRAATESAMFTLSSMERTPWGEFSIMRRFLDLIPQVAAIGTGTMGALAAKLRTPFAGGALYEERVTWWLTLSVTPGAVADCRAPLEYFERGAPLTESYLEARLTCFERFSDPGIAETRRALEAVKARNQRE